MMKILSGLAKDRINIFIGHVKKQAQPTAAVKKQRSWRRDTKLDRVSPRWSTHQTGEDCEYGAGFTCLAYKWMINARMIKAIQLLEMRYFMDSATGRTQWTRPDEDDTWHPDQILELQLRDKTLLPPVTSLVKS